VLEDVQMSIPVGKSVGIVGASGAGKTTAVDILKDALVTGDDSGVAKVKMILCTVKDDLHDIGKNIVRSMLEAAGFEVLDLGIDVSARKFIDAIAKNPDVTLVGLSALLTTTLPAMQETVRTLNAQPFRDRIKIMVGGTPVTEEFAKKIGADGYSRDAAEAVTLAKRLMEESVRG